MIGVVLILSSKYLVSRFLFGHNLMNTSMGNSNAYTQAATEFAQMLQATMPANIQVTIIVKSPL